MPPVTPSAISMVILCAQAECRVRRPADGMSFSTFASRTSFWPDRTGFSVPVVSGVHPPSSCLARAPDTTTNSNLFTLSSFPLNDETILDDDWRASRVEPRPLGEHDGAQPVDARVQLVVDDDVVVFGERRPLPAWPSPAAARIASSVSLLRPRSRCSSTSNDGGSTKIPMRSRRRARTCRAPWTSMTSTRSRPLGELALGVGRAPCRRGCRRRRPTRGRRPAGPSPRSVRG